jgi:hypothetical protein
MLTILECTQCTPTFVKQHIGTRNNNFQAPSLGIRDPLGGWLSPALRAAYETPAGDYQQVSPVHTHAGLPSLPGRFHPQLLPKGLFP